MELIGDGRRYRKDIQVKRDFRAETGGEDQNEDKARDGAKKEGNEVDLYQAETEDIGGKNHGILQAIRIDNGCK